LDQNEKEFREICPSISVYAPSVRKKERKKERKEVILMLILVGSFILLGIDLLLAYIFFV